MRGASAYLEVEPAAAGLPDDPRVLYHLARTYAALGREDEALAQFARVVEAVGEGPEPEFMAEVEAEIARLSEGAGAARD